MSSELRDQTPEIRGQRPEGGTQWGRHCSDLAAVLLCLMAAGCADEHLPQRVALEGEVRLDGKPLKSGQIRFIPTGTTEGPSAAATITDGHYAFDNETGPIAGTHRVEIDATNYLGFEMDDERAFAEFARSGEIRNRNRTLNPVPARYNTQSTLTRTVAVDSEGPLDFDLSADVQFAGQ